ncbi:hypothetical protein NDU88_006845 [Pleurodeles waltl]|uniref:Uncharacterized protein n=1 Tax=Pleurodeles waltl TaxID=8319 RepID=A0AAV7UP11_PLEWA|nr:hypothetical protein NDU88_006845 [Pleurodeles waltl]
MEEGDAGTRPPAFSLTTSGAPKGEQLHSDKPSSTTQLTSLTFDPPLEFQRRTEWARNAPMGPQDLARSFHACYAIPRPANFFKQHETTDPSG